MQEEVYEDRYPIVLINGMRLAQEVASLAMERGCPNIISLLDDIDATYDGRLADRHPEDVLAIL